MDKTIQQSEFINSVNEKKPSILTVRGSEKHRRTVSDGRSQKSETKVRFSPDERSNYSAHSKNSKRSGMTRNPLHYEENVL